MQTLTGEPLALDFINTLASTPDGEIDALHSADELQVWLSAQADRLTAPSAPRTETDLAAIRLLRTHVETTLHAVLRGEEPASEAVAAINHAARCAPLHRVITFDDGRPVATTGRDGDDLTQLLAQLAEAAVELVTSPHVVRIRTCDGPNCRMMFLPAHPRRRWCSPALCGNRVRVARYYQRHRSADGA